MKSASLQYSNALADIAFAHEAAEPAVRQLVDFGAAFAASVELQNFLASPAVLRSDKHAVIQKIAARIGASKIIRNFLFVIVDHRRTQLLPDIIAAFQEVVRQRQGIVEAEISSATELNRDQKAQLAKTLERLTRKKVEAKFSVNPALLGGAVVRVGDTIYDGSVRNRLNEMRARLAAE